MTKPSPSARPQRRLRLRGKARPQPRCPGCGTPITSTTGRCWECDEKHAGPLAAAEAKQEQPLPEMGITK